jgi:hypothetical protein
MQTDYSLDTIRTLEAEASKAGELRPFRRTRYEPGDVIEAAITGVAPAHRAHARFEIKRFAGGGFAGQVYQVEIKELTPESEPLTGLEVGKICALKILVPPSRFSRMFRNLVYWLAYQGPFSAQVNPAASRVGVLWQKIIRRGASIRFERDDAVADTYATFHVPELNSFAEINEWVPGRTWLYEIDDRVIERKNFDPDDPDGVEEGAIALEEAASREFLGKRVFMRRLVQLFHDMGAPELARQYEWWTCKSQPNALRRLDAGDGPMDGLCAIDFRAGLALLPFVPMSPGDFRLIHEGFQRGNAVQFDRGDLEKLEDFMETHRGAFEDLFPALEELKVVEAEYRSSLPDITHHGARVFFDDDLRPRIKAGLVQGYESAGLVDAAHAAKLKKSSIAFFLFYVIGAIPFLGAFLRRLWGNARYRKHLGRTLTSFSYMTASMRARMAESLIGWVRKGRCSEKRALALLRMPYLFWPQRLTIGFLPAKLHRCIAEPSYPVRFVVGGVLYGWKFYRDADFREEWLTEQVKAGREEGMLTEAEEKEVLDAVKDPFIKKYLLCVAVHIATLPVTQLVSVVVAIWVMVKYGQTWQEAIAYGLGVMAAFQLTVISPGSLVRGLFTTYLVISERNWQSYKIAAYLSFWKYIGYLAFPIQMVQQYPVLARLMAGRWAASMVHIVPVFGEKGALLEHWVFDLFFNVPVSLARSSRKKKENERARAAGQGAH